MRYSIPCIDVFEKKDPKVIYTVCQINHRSSNFILLLLLVFGFNNDVKENSGG